VLRQMLDLTNRQPSHVPPATTACRARYGAVLGPALFPPAERQRP
jgi:hypothetical protein